VIEFEYGKNKFTYTEIEFEYGAIDFVRALFEHRRRTPVLGRTAGA